MPNPSVFTELEFFAFHRIVMAHTLISDNYSFHLESSENSIYGNLASLVCRGQYAQHPNLVVLVGRCFQFDVETRTILLQLAA